jgi:hypothetical protein
MIPFKEAKKTGDVFVQPVKLTNEQGFTYGDGVVTLSDAISSNVKDARINGNSLTLRTAFSYSAAANMANGGKQSFISATKFRFESMMESASARLEAQMLYGQDSLGVISSADDGADTITLTDASWAPGIWSGAEGAKIEILTANKATSRVTAAITAVDHDTKTISLASGTDLSAVIATDVVLFDGAHTAGVGSNEMVGLKSIVSNTGTLYSIDGSAYSLWRGNTSAVGGNLTLKKIYDGVAKAVSKGLMEDCVVLVSPASFSVLANDQASLKRHGSDGIKAKNGYEAVEFYGQNGNIEIVPHPMVKESEAMAFPKGKCERIGATDFTFNTPGSEGGEMFKQLANSTGYECRLYSEQAKVA